MNKKSVILTSTLVLLSFVLTFGLVNAHGNESLDNNQDFPKENFHQTMLNAIENGDYNEWKELVSDMGHSKMMQFVNQDNFSEFRDAHLDAMSGDYEAMNSFRENRMHTGTMDMSNCPMHN